MCDAFWKSYSTLFFPYPVLFHYEMVARPTKLIPCLTNEWIVTYSLKNTDSYLDTQNLKVVTLQQKFAKK